MDAWKFTLAYFIVSCLRFLCHLAGSGWNSRKTIIFILYIFIMSGDEETKRFLKACLALCSCSAPRRAPAVMKSPPTGARTNKIHAQRLTHNSRLHNANTTTANAARLTLDSVMSDPATVPADNLTSQPPPSSEAPAATLPSTTQPQPPPQPARADNQSPKPEAQSASTEQKKDAVPDANRNEEATIATAVADKAGNQEEPKLSGTELKKRAKAEKAARRAREKEAAQKSEQNRPADADGGGGKGGGAGQSKKGGGQGPRGSVSGESTMNTKSTKAVRQASAAATEGKKKKGPVQRDDKTVAVFGHLGGKRRSTIAGLGKEIHPAILSLGLQLVDYVICGSSARCMATLLAFKRVSGALDDV